jgi:OOP family OmpA-OmpF porin/outer membrane immunogenic protein
MRSSVVAIALATAGLCAGPVVSHAAEGSGDNGGGFVNGNIGRSNLDKGAYKDSDTGYGANIGYRWALNPNVALGIEGGYTSLGTFDPRSGPGDLGVGRAEVKGWTLGVNGHFNLTPQWYLSGRTGMFRADVTGGYLDPANLPVAIDDHSNKYYAGAGFGYDFSNSFSVGLNYDKYKAKASGIKLDPDLVSVSAEVRF